MSGDTSARVVIADDEPLARERLRMLLEGQADIEVTAECQDGTQAIDAIRRLRPDLVFLDVQMPGATGFEVVAALDQERLPLVVFVTAAPPPLPGPQPRTCAAAARSRRDQVGRPRVLRTGRRDRLDRVGRQLREAPRRRRRPLVPRDDERARGAALPGDLLSDSPLLHREHRACEGAAALVQR